MCYWFKCRLLVLFYLNLSRILTSFLKFNHSSVFCMLFLMLQNHYFLTICEEEEVFLSKMIVLFGLFYSMLHRI